MENPRFITSITSIMRLAVYFMIWMNVFKVGISSPSWYQTINVQVCIKSNDDSIDWCVTCIPCPSENVYDNVQAACPYGAAGDCRHLCSIYEEGTDYSYIDDAAKAFNEFAECHINTVEYKNVSLTPSRAITGTTNAQTPPSSPLPPTTRLSFGEAMIVVLCSGIFVVIVGGLCRTGCNKREERLKKRDHDDVEATRMSVEIRQIGNGEPPIRRMSIGPADVSREGCMGSLFPKYPKLKEPSRNGKNKGGASEYESTAIERSACIPSENRIPTAATTTALTVQPHLPPQSLPQPHQGQRQPHLPPQSLPHPHPGLRQPHLPPQSLPHPHPGQQPESQNLQPYLSTPPVQIHVHGQTNLINHNRCPSVEDQFPNAFSKATDLPTDIQQWMNIFREKDVRERICSSVDPICLLDCMPNVLKQEEEEWVKQTEGNEGRTRACRRLLGFIVASENREWPDVLLTALEEANYLNQADFLRNAHMASLITQSFTKDDLDTTQTEQNETCESDASNVIFCTERITTV